MARRYQYTFGRFSSPDPIMGSPDNPQRWNRYQYVLNAPNVYTDPDGRDIAACYIFWTGDGDLETSFCAGGSTGSAVDEVWGIGLAIYSVERDAAFNSADERANRAREDRLNAMKDVCQLKIQDAVNQQFATGTDAVKLEADPDSGFHHGGAWNFNFTAQDLPQTEFNDIKQKRYNLPNGASLHVPNPQWHLLPFLPNPFDPNATWQRNPNNNSITFTAHIDSANGGAFPFGTIKHFFKDVLGNGSRNPCP